MAKHKMPNARKTLQPPERDYSHRSLLNKLGVKSGHRIFVLDILDSSFLNEIKPFAPTFEQVKPRGDCDLSFFGAEAEGAMKRLAHLRQFIRKNGGIWVVYPKGKQHIRENDVTSAGKAAGLTDTKVCGFSPTHTARRFVIPLVQRQAMTCGEFRCLRS